MSTVEPLPVENYFIYFIKNCTYNVYIPEGSYDEKNWDKKPCTNQSFKLKVYRKFVKWLEYKNILVKQNINLGDYIFVLTDYEKLNIHDQWVLAQIIYAINSKKRDFKFVTDEQIPDAADLNVLFSLLCRWVTFNKLVEPEKYVIFEKTGLDKLSYSSGGVGVTLLSVFTPLGLTGAIPGALGIVFTALGGLFTLSSVPLYMCRNKRSAGVTGEILLTDKVKKWIINNQLENS